MIVKFHPRGRGGGAGPVDYLLGKDRMRSGASVLQGKPEEVRELIDASPYAKKYTSGVLSFAEADIPAGQREKLMASFERILMPGLDKDQYSILWVEHTDKGRLELNFLIPNTELLSGRRLQPYFDRADRPRVDAWQTVVNGRLGLHDPDAPENRRALVTPSALPETKQAACEAITVGLLSLASSGDLKTRQDVTEALEQSGFTVVRTTKNSISIADPDGGQNIRLRGALYEQSFNAGEGLRAAIESAAAAYRRDAERRIQRAREVCQNGTDRKRRENQQRHPRPREGYDRSHAVEPAERAANGRPHVADHHDSVRAVAGQPERGTVVPGEPDKHEPGGNRAAKQNAVGAERENVGCEIPGKQRGALSDTAGRHKSGHGLDVRQRQEEQHPTGEGVEQHDRAGKTVTERIRAVTAGLLEKAGRMGERLRGMADDVWSYATGEREAERAGERLECAGAEFKRNAGPVIDELNAEARHRADVQRRQQPQSCIQQPPRIVQYPETTPEQPAPRNRMRGPSL